jgi:hypothetical protein
VEEVQELLYLGSKVINGGNSEKDANTRIIKATDTFDVLKTIWKSNNSKSKPNSSCSIVMSSVCFCTTLNVGGKHPDCLEN